MAPEPAGPAVRLFPTQSMFQHVRAEGWVTLLAPESLEWTASASVPWIHLHPPTRGQGHHTLAYRVEANSDEDRQGIITLAGQRLTVQQLAPPGWQERQVLIPKLSVIERVGLQASIDQIQKLPPELQPAAYLALLATVEEAAERFHSLYEAAPQVPQHYTGKFIRHELALSRQFILDQMKRR